MQKGLQGWLKKPWDGDRRPEWPAMCRNVRECAGKAGDVPEWLAARMAERLEASRHRMAGKDLGYQDGLHIGDRPEHPGNQGIAV